MTLMDFDPTTVSTGVKTVLAYDNIAIVVLSLVAIGEAAMIYILLNNILKMKDVLAALTNAITILNERIKND